MMDRIFESWLVCQNREAEHLAAESDILSLEVADSAPVPRAFIARFNCRGAVWTPDGVAMTDRLTVGIAFPLDYLRRVTPELLITILEPRTVYHPNIAGPFVCLGRLAPGTPLVDLLMAVHSLWTYQHFRPQDPLNEAAAAWARDNQDLFPLDRRPLRRRVGTSLSGGGAL